MLAIEIAALLGASLYLLLFYDNGHGGFAYEPPAPSPDVERPEGTRRTVHFSAVDGTRLEGWLFLPRTSRPPLVLMATGLTGTKDAHLDGFAWAFVRAGVAVLSFDYRNFGGSDGQPRHWVSPARHREDYEAAADFAHSCLGDVVDAERLALWGSSFSGGTVLVLAATRPEHVRAVVAQAPFLETPPALEPSRGELARYVAWTMLDLLRSRLSTALPLGLAPIYVPVFGRPGERVFAKSRECPSLAGDEPGSRFWREMPAQRGGWENKMLARLLAELDEFVPMKRVAEIACPVMLVAARTDDLIPVDLVQRAASQLRHPDSVLAEIDCGHFDLYVDPVVAANAERQALFLRRALRRRSASPCASESL